MTNYFLVGCYCAPKADIAASKLNFALVNRTLEGLSLI